MAALWASPSLSHVAFPYFPAQRKWRECHQTWVILLLGTKEPPPLPPKEEYEKSTYHQTYLHYFARIRILQLTSKKGEKP